MHPVVIWVLFSFRMLPVAKNVELKGLASSEAFTPSCPGSQWCGVPDVAEQVIPEKACPLLRKGPLERGIAF